MHMDRKALYGNLISDLKRFYKQEGRSHLPWRVARDPYHVLVSEMMLQQTQVDRVVPFYERFIKKYPTARALGKTKLPEVLKLWQGLGYNRRAKYLHEAAKVLTQEKFIGQKLPGVGPYTRGAVLAFALNKPEVFIETNIRTVFFHYLGGNKVMSDAQLVPLVAEALERSRMEPRDFYAALMDYGSHLKKQGIKLNNRSSHYAKQSKFEGSVRQLRGAILRELLVAPATPAQLQKKIPRSAGEIERELSRLRQEGLVAVRVGRFRIAA
jgi:A/G-specific adenine glycosylase